MPSRASNATPDTTQPRFALGDVVAWHLPAGDGGLVFCEVGVGVVIHRYQAIFRHNAWIYEIETVAYDPDPFTVYAAVEEIHLRPVPHLTRKQDAE